jgi:hypothetical protein
MLGSVTVIIYVMCVIRKTRRTFFISTYNQFRRNPGTSRRTRGWFEVLTAVSVKMAVFWVVAPCSLVCFSISRPDDGGSMVLWNVCQFLAVYTALQPRRRPSSTARRSSAPWHAPKVILCLSSTENRNAYVFLNYTVRLLTQCACLRRQNVADVRKYWHLC